MYDSYADGDVHSGKQETPQLCLWEKISYTVVGTGIHSSIDVLGFTLVHISSGGPRKQ